MPLILEFGSRAGSWFALAFFAVIFGALGWGVAREVRRRSSSGPAIARVLGLAVFLGPILLVYASMLSGFYELEMSGGSIKMRYLIPGTGSEIAPATATARIAPAYRDRVRLVISDGQASYTSTPWPRARVNEALLRLNDAMRANDGGKPD